MGSLPNMDTQKYDIVIIGAGPVGLLLSVCLARWGYKIKHIDNRPVPTATGRADGIQPRSIEILKNLRLKRQIFANDPARVYEVAFWDPQPEGKGIHRTGTWASCPKFIDARYPFTALLHQGMIERVFIDDLKKNGTKVDRPWTITGFNNDGQDPTYPVSVELKNLDSNVTETVRAKYLFSGEGARSFVREQLKVQIRHKDPISHVWGVMDGVIRTNFPDIKMKCTIHSDHGSIMVIPRENNMVRLYIQIASSDDKDWDPRKSATVQEVQDAAIRILKPYYLEWERVEWYSVYPIGQGIADKYTLDHRVFMGGDVCHTHSPKAGQGMNTAFHDALNFAWKVHLVEAGFASRSLLESYEEERRDVAETLLDFDNKYAALFSKRQPSSSEVGAANTHHANGKTNGEVNGDTKHGETNGDSKNGDSKDGEEKNEFIEMFKSNCEFTSGFGVAYKPNVLNWSSDHAAKSDLFNPKDSKLRTGHVMHPANVTRVSDANVVHLENEIPVNGSFRIYIFGGLPSKTQQAIKDLAENISRKESFYGQFSYPAENKPDLHHEAHNPHSPFYTLAVIFNAKRPDIEVSDLPEILADYKQHVYADDIPDARVPEAKAAAHAKMGLDEERGGVVVVRPDGHVGCVVQLTEGSGTVDALNSYFASFTTQGGGFAGKKLVAQL